MITIFHTLLSLYLFNPLKMTIKQAINPFNYLINYFKNFVRKLFQNPEYHTIRLQSKFRNRNRQKEQES